MKLGKQIAELRKNQKMSQEDLAEKIGVSRQAVTKWESGDAVPEIEKLISLADYFGISLDALVGRDETNYDKMKTIIDKLASNSAREYEGDISPMLQGYMDYMKRIGMSDKQIVEGILEMCKED